MRQVDPPHPNWKPGDKQSHPFPSDEMIELDPAEVGPSEMYPFIISSIVPRPIAFICSLSKKVSKSSLHGLSKSLGPRIVSLLDLWTWPNTDTLVWSHCLIFSCTSVQGSSVLDLDSQVLCQRNTIEDARLQHLNTQALHLRIHAGYHKSVSLQLFQFYGSRPSCLLHWHLFLTSN